jgi:hypothetical protein
MYTTKEIQDMIQYDSAVAKAKELTTQTIAFIANLSHQNAVYFDKLTDSKFTTYTDSFRKGVDKLAEQTTEFVQDGKVPSLYGNSK